MGVEHAFGIGPRRVDRGMDDEAGRIDRSCVVLDDVAVEIDLDQVRGGDLLEQHAVGIEQEVILRAPGTRAEMWVGNISSMP